MAVPSGRLVKDAFDMAELPKTLGEDLFGSKRRSRRDAAMGPARKASPLARRTRLSPLRIEPPARLQAAMDSMAT
jgi:hypothetical protein